MVNLEWYRSFLEVCRCGTVSAAARSLYLTQPAVSQHVAALEAAIGGALFTRAPRRMIPTEKGKELYTEVVQAIEKLEFISQNLKLNQELEKPLFRLGAPFEYFYGRILKELGKIDCRVWVQFGVTPLLIDGLKAGHFDAIVATQKIVLPEIDCRKLDDENFILVGPTKMKSWTTKKMDAQEMEEAEQWLLEQDWLSYGVELPIIRRFWQEVFKRRSEIKPAFVLPNLHAILKGIELGLGISLLPEYLCRDALRRKSIKVLLKLPGVISNEIWLAYRKVEGGNPLIKEFYSRVKPKESLRK